MKKLKLFLFPFLIIALAYVVFTLFIHKHAIKPTYAPLSVTTNTTLTWPTSDEAAVGVVGTKILDIRGNQVPKPTASTAKLITALMVLRAKPLSLNEQGPTLTLSANDVSIYAKYISEQGSVAAVAVGEQISEYQMLEGMLLPSANNMADSLAIWAYGSLSAYAGAANTYISSLGLNGTHIGGDASGFDPSTVSTAQDLVKIGELVMQNPVLASIVDQPSAILPVVGSVNNVNNLLGRDNIVGVKTGNTSQAGGVFVGAVKFNVGSQTKTVVTANVGASTLSQALNSSVPLLQSVQTNFHGTTLVKAGSEVASYKVPWAKILVPAVTSQVITANVWGGDTFKLPSPELKTITAGTKNSSVIGTYDDASLGSTSSQITLEGRLPQPSIWWRLTHP